MNSSYDKKELATMQIKLGAVIPKLPKLVGNEAVNFFKDSWKRQAWLGGTLNPWKKRSLKSKRNKGRAILMNTGRLRRSIRIIKASATSVTVGTDVPYAKAHNEGFKGGVSVKSHTRMLYGKKHVEHQTKTGKTRIKTVQTIKGSTQVTGHMRKMNLPQRQFMGNSPYLTSKIKALVTQTILKALK